jgi:hypothetical protein
MKIYIIGLLLSISVLYGATTQEQTNGREKLGEKPPVDEGFEHKPKEDKVKGVTFATDTKAVTFKIYLSKEKDIISIKFKKVTRVPLTCKIMRQNKEIFSKSKKPKNPRESRSLEFKIEKSILKVGDSIEIINRKKRVVGQVEVVK